MLAVSAVPFFGLSCPERRRYFWVTAKIIPYCNWGHFHSCHFVSTGSFKCIIQSLEKVRHRICLLQLLVCCSPVTWDNHLSSLDTGQTTETSLLFSTPASHTYCSASRRETVSSLQDNNTENWGSAGTQWNVKVLGIEFMLLYYTFNPIYHIMAAFLIY